MSAVANHIREAALGEAPQGAGPRSVSAWLGLRSVGRCMALDRLHLGELFYLAPEEQQRTYLLLVSEAA